MSSFVLSCMIFALTLGGIGFGTLLRRVLPKHHLSKDSQDVVRLGAGLIATITALVLGLLITAAKSSFDTQNTQIKQITADIILLDNLLAQYGPEAHSIREQMRSTIGPLADRLWQEQKASAAGRFEANAAGEKVYLDIQALSPQNDLQRSLQARAAQISTDIAQTRLLLFVESDNLIPAPFLAILVFWLIIIFASFSLFSELNVTVFRFSIPVRAIGVVRTVSNIGTQRAVHGSHDDIKRAAAECARTLVTPQELKSAAAATNRAGRNVDLCALGPTCDISTHFCCAAQCGGNYNHVIGYITGGKCDGGLHHLARGAATINLLW